MEIVYMLLAYLGFVCIPFVIYLLRVKPVFSKKAVSVFVSGFLMVLAGSMPIGFLYLFQIWKNVTPILLTLTALVWLIGAVKKKQEFLAGPMMTGSTVICSGILLMNWFAVIMAVVYFVMLVRCRYDYSVD